MTIKININIQIFKGYSVIKKIKRIKSNISGSVDFLLAGAEKRRVMAARSAKNLNSDMNLGKKGLFLLK